MRYYRRKVQKVVDGDTFKVRSKINNSQYIRIARINAPERGERGYHSAKSRLAKRIQGKTVTIKLRGRSYGRTVAYVTHRRRAYKGCRW